ncbi:MAG TPA: hypothetical protein VEB40_05485 [Flavipsychrobacter sp.]|nr:hypothetical protein [Flavipsychrobacter sp.]
MERIKHTLQLDEDLELFQKGWVIHVTAWIVFCVIIFLAAIGLFGTGPLSYETEAGPGGTIQYERFLRFEAETEVNISADNTTGVMQLVLPRDYLSYINIIRFNPEPLGIEQGNNTVIYNFPARGRAQISMTIRPKKGGMFNTNIWVNGNSFPLFHLIYP